MRVPRALIVRGEQWDVERVRDVESHWPDLPTCVELRGYVDRETRTILIDRDLDDGDDPAAVTLHELLHILRPSWTESQVVELERDLWPVLRDNGLWRRR
jgi:hypothetical protein